MDDTRAAIYRAAYRTMIGWADLCIAFFEAALRQFKAGAVRAFTCADR
jgi:adenine-specific DNA-methyltransferase